MKKDIKNLPASIHDRLKSIAIQNNRPFQEYLFYYAIERFLFRLSRSNYRNEFVLKGGLMFMAWGIPLRRSTRDIDVQGYGINSIENYVSIVKRICLEEVKPDGMHYFPESVRGEIIQNLAEINGVRIYFKGNLGNASVQLHLDISFANVITPNVLDLPYPCLLEKSDIQIKGYPIETTISEKFQAMVSLDRINDRMKDFFDIWLIIHQMRIEGSILFEAIQKTFNHRKTPLPTKIPFALTTEFADNKQRDWERFLSRSLLDINDFKNFDEVIQTLQDFLYPIVEASHNGDKFNRIWQAGVGWE
ncbi:MAG TPA: nucleotidyl transferase AbiEii/AbiGii toxin family protein [Anaerolineaceae bacterium]|nr:nucleotidyl transferase AbiEii/AbiGii toxin family protein [Anaerolineaceae bacterium]